MQLVVLAAGHGRRFGGLKQLAPVGPDGQAIMDFTAGDALAAGFDGVVLIVRDEVADELLAHVSRHWPSDLPVVPVTQGPVAGTAQAVASARSAVSGAFGVVNADDLYGTAAISMLATEIAALDRSTHAIVGYELGETILTDAPVTRGLCETDDDSNLVRVVETTVQREGSGYHGVPLISSEGSAPAALSGTEIVSMNLWGFAHSIFDELDAALEAFDPETAPHQPGKPPELLLPSVVADAVTTGSARVRVTQASGRCIGITHPDDLPLVRRIVAEEIGRRAET